MFTFPDRLKLPPTFGRVSVAQILIVYIIIDGFFIKETTILVKGGYQCNTVIGSLNIFASINIDFVIVNLKPNYLLLLYSYESFVDTVVLASRRLMTYLYFIYGMLEMY